MAGPLPVFIGPGSQRGYGLGGMLSGLFRTAMPFLKKGALSLGKEVGKQALTTGAGILEDVMAGENIKRSATRRAKETGQRMKRKAMARARAAMAQQTGRGGGQRGRGKRVIKRTARTRTVITTKDAKKKAARPTRGRKGMKIPFRRRAPATSNRSSSSGRRSNSSRLSDSRLNAYIRQRRTPSLSPVSAYTPLSYASYSA